MDKLISATQQQLLSLLRLGIHGEEPENELFSSINSLELYELALRQNVSALVYPVLKKYYGKIKLDKEIMEKWRMAFLFMITKQIEIMKGLETIINQFNSAEIPAISLKGLALKQVYPSPELRNMSDVDLLIHEQDMKISIELLYGFGYQVNLTNLNDPDYMHIDMHKPDSLTVELHRTLWHPKHMKKMDDREWLNHIWSKKRPLNLDGIECQALSLEDELINLVVHLARNLKNNNANLQQLCDIVFFLNNYFKQIDFDYVNQTLNSMKLFSYYQYLISTCDMFFGLTHPINNRNISRKKCIRLMKTILDANQQGEHLVIQKIKITLDGISMVRKLLKPLCTTRARLLRSIGLHLKY